MSDVAGNEYGYAACRLDLECRGEGGVKFGWSMPCASRGELTALVGSNPGPMGSLACAGVPRTMTQGLAAAGHWLCISGDSHVKVTEVISSLNRTLLSGARCFGLILHKVPGYLLRQFLSQKVVLHSTSCPSMGRTARLFHVCERNTRNSPNPLQYLSSHAEVSHLSSYSTYRTSMDYRTH